MPETASGAPVPICSVPPLMVTAAGVLPVLSGAPARIRVPLPVLTRSPATAPNVPDQVVLLLSPPTVKVPLLMLMVPPLPASEP